MPIVIKPKRSETASSIPSTSDLAVGELGMYTADQKLYTKNSSNVIVEVANSAVAGVSEATATDNAVAMSIALG